MGHDGFSLGGEHIGGSRARPFDRIGSGMVPGRHQSPSCHEQEQCQHIPQGNFETGALSARHTSRAIAASSMSASRTYGRCSSPSCANGRSGGVRPDRGEYQRNPGGCLVFSSGNSPRPPSGRWNRCWPPSTALPTNCSPVKPGRGPLFHFFWTGCRASIFFCMDCSLIYEHSEFKE